MQQNRHAVVSLATFSLAEVVKMQTPSCESPSGMSTGHGSPPCKRAPLLQTEVVGFFSTSGLLPFIESSAGSKHRPSSKRRNERGGCLRTGICVGLQPTAPTRSFRGHGPVRYEAPLDSSQDPLSRASPDYRNKVTWSYIEGRRIARQARRKAFSLPQ